MNIIQLGNLNVKYGGPALSLSLLMKGLIESDVRTTCLMHELPSDGKLIDDTLPTVYYKESYSPGLSKVLFGRANNYEMIQNFDLLHIQGFWGIDTHNASYYARKYGKPYIISPRGTLYPQGLAIHPLKKRIALKCLLGTDLKKASCIHATCPEERDYYWDLGYQNPVAILPNPFDCSLINEDIHERKTFRVGYLGRLHPRKHVERLIYAFAEKREELNDSELVIIGTDIPEYENFLKSEIKRLQLTNVTFAGFLSGREKYEVLRSLSMLAMPSDFENFGNVVPEALAQGVPVMSSKGAPWQSLLKYNCGWWADNDQHTINRIIVEAHNKAKSEIVEMGKNGQNYVKKELSHLVLGQRMKLLYEWILKGGETPDFVYFR